MTVKEAASLWNITERRVADYCKAGRIRGAIKVGRSWIIPLDSEKPLTDEIEVKVVSTIDNLQFFLGKTKNDIVTGNKISENDVQNLIINIEDMNYIDLIVLVDSNGENVEFNYVHETIIPVYFNLNQNDYDYFWNYNFIFNACCSI